MKPFTTNFLISIYNFNKPLLCSKKSFTRLSSLWRWCSSLALAVKDRALLAIRAGSVACRELATNVRHSVGVLFIVVGFGASISYHIFNPLVINKEWYYLNWFYFLYTIREELLIGFWAVGTFLLLPKKYTLSFIPCTFALAYSIAGIIHFSFFVNSNESFHKPMYLELITCGLSLALGFIICTDYLVHRFEHYRRGNHQRFPAIVRAPGLTIEQKWPLLEKNADDYYRLNEKI